LNDINDPTAQLKPPFAPGRKKFSEGDVVSLTSCVEDETLMNLGDVVRLLGQCGIARDHDRRPKGERSNVTRKLA
jgi:hypothetical protein